MNLFGLKLGKARKPEESAERMEPHVMDEALADNRIARASEWQLVRWKFGRHKLAVISLVVLAIMYFGVLFSDSSPLTTRENRSRTTSSCRPVDPFHRRGR